MSQKSTSAKEKPQSTNVIPFKFKTNEVRTINQEDGAIWFVAKDVCDVLDLKNPTKAISALDDDEKNTLTFSKGNRGNPNMNIINESGLYTLILRSNKPEAKAFRKWVTSEVLPAIRKTGRYVMPCITPAQQREIQKMVSMKAYAIAKGEKPTRNIFMQIYRGIKDHFQVGTYKQVPAKRFNELIEFLGVEFAGKIEDDNDTVKKKKLKGKKIKRLPAPQRTYYLPLKQAREISKRINRVMTLFHPLSEQFSDMLGISRALAGLDPNLGLKADDFVKISHEV